MSRSRSWKSGAFQRRIYRDVSTYAAWKRRSSTVLQSDDHMPKIGLAAGGIAEGGCPIFYGRGSCWLHLPRALANCETRWWTFRTGFGSGKRLPSSRIGISLSNSGPECDPVMTMRMG
jgi:hypothetical protein